jgi:hypothetical protein
LGTGGESSRWVMTGVDGIDSGLEPVIDLSAVSA